MEVRSEQGIMSSREQFGVALQINPVQSQPSMQNMRLAFTPDGAAIYKQVNSSSPPYQGASGAGEAPGGGGDGVAVPPAVAPHGLHMNMGEPLKRKRGRPRKYGPDGGMSLGLNSLSPVVAVGSTGFSSPLAGNAPNPASSASAGATKKPRGRPPGSGKKKQMAALGSAGIGFTPHVITVKAGEDVYSKIMSFSHHGPRAVCIMSANGAISNVTLRQAAMSGGTVTYEGRFEILSLSGSFLLSESGGQRSRTGGLSVSLAGPDGRVLGGGVAGLLTAASPVQVIAASFIADGHRESNQVDPSEPSSAPEKFTPGVTSATGSPPSRGTLSESSGAPGSPLNNQSSAAFHNHHQHGMLGMPWK